MMFRIAAAVVMASTLLFAGSASAQAEEGPRPLGIRLETSLASDFNLAWTTNTGIAGSPHGDLRIGYDLDNGFTPLIGLGYRSHSNTTTTAGNEAESSESVITLSLEGRYYLQKHRRGLQPFVWGELNTSFVSIDEDGEDDELGADQADHTNFNLGFGAEYKFTRSFAVGGKWGLGFGFKPWEDDDDNKASDTTLGTSSSIYLAWRF